MCSSDLSRGYSEIEVFGRISKEVDALLKENPGVSAKIVFTTVTNTQASYESALQALIEGSLLAVLVVWLFLRESRSTAISALAIPLSAIPTFAFMQWMDFTLNNISLLALSLVAGVLVDDAIVEIENIVRHIRMGKTPYQAALDAADEIGLAVVATSATIIAVFLPVSFMGGMSGQYFKQFGLTVAAAVFFSLLVARLITPVIAAFTLRPEKAQSHLDGPVMAWYLRALRYCVEHRRRTFAGFALFFVASIAGLFFIPKNAFPNEDMGTSQITVELAPGVRIEDTARVTSRAAQIVASHPEVEDVLETVGGGDDNDIRNGQLFVALKPHGERKIDQKTDRKSTRLNSSH